MIFYLGTHHPNWLSLVDVPLFISRRRLVGIKKMPRARDRVGIDSSGFTVLNLLGYWDVTPRDYSGEVQRFVDEIGNIDFAAQQDWMCEPRVLKKTGLTVAEHQTRTVDNYIELMTLAPHLPWIPVLQGFAMDEYRNHIDQFQARGVDLFALPRVGIGSVCRRQGTAEVEGLIKELHASGLRLHGFGFKAKGLPNVAGHLASSDSMAWSFMARKQKILMDGCTTHQNCANCRLFALEWRRRLMASLVVDSPPREQLRLAV